ncbi:MAG: hypothetical protein AMJ90_09345 [candidate division Zixibacteria bacterium SM23_73_2]|nr:MAG: hypothetical protein AMJ90_09345 [candidate division Zixibacteria bacterium SM23_73_2]
MDKKAYTLIIISAVLFCLTFSPLHFGFLAYFFGVFIIYALEKKKNFEAFRLGYIFGLITNSILLYWIGYATIPGTIGAILALSFYTAVLFLIYAQIQKIAKERTYLLFPFLWVGMEFGRSLLDIGFPWLNLAYTQTYYLKLIQHASFTGAFGVSFWVACLNVIAYFGIKNFPNIKKLTLAFALFFLFIIIPYIHGTKVMPEKIEKGDLKIALLQGSIEQHIKWDPKYLDYNFQVYTKMSKEAAKKGVDLIIWPETATPTYLLHDPKYFNVVISLAESLKTPIFTGGLHFENPSYDEYTYYNSAFLFTPDGDYPKIYSKIRLVPFSERMPFGQIIPFIRRIQVGGSDFTPGEDYVIFEHPKGKFACLICFESVFPDLVRDFARRGADFLVNVTNDAWFGKSPGPFQHSRIAIFRAIENRISIARCANTGVSMLVDPYGRVYNQTRIFVQENVVDDISLRKNKTFFTEYGDFFGKGSFLISILFFGLSFLLKKL